MSFQGSCPSCAAPVRFDVDSSLVTVCPNCRTLCGRGDGKLEDYGKIADLFPTRSPIRIGVEGRYRGKTFQVIGRSQYQHAAGGVWDEWYLTFFDGKLWGWLSEAQGRMALTFERDIPENMEVPSVSELQLGQEFTFPKLGKFEVSETGTARLISAEGEIPFLWQAGDIVAYADLTGAGKKFASFSEEEGELYLYAGQTVDFETIGISDSLRDRELEEASISVARVNCPTCAAPLEIQAPDQSLRVACQYCGSLHDCNQGNLKFLKKMGNFKYAPWIPLGSTGTIDPSLVEETWQEPQTFTIIGFLVRRVRYEGIDYVWHEYLLYAPRLPFYWLSYYKGHWSFGKPVEPGEAWCGIREARYPRVGGNLFKLYDRSKPDVVAVLGEFYWKVSVGEKVRLSDYICPPYVLSEEKSLEAIDQTPRERRGIFQERKKSSESSTSHSDAVSVTSKTKHDLSAQEVNVTLGVYIPQKEVEKAFQLSNLPKPQGVAPSQPYPFKGIYKIALMLFLLACLIGIINFASGTGKTLLARSVSVPVNGGAESLLGERITMRGRRNLQIKVRSSGWAYVEGHFFHEKDGITYPISFASRRGSLYFSFTCRRLCAHSFCRSEKVSSINNSQFIRKCRFPCKENSDCYLQRGCGTWKSVLYFVDLPGNHSRINTLSSLFF